MKLEKQLKKLKKAYLKIEPPADLQEYGWAALKKAIEADEKHKSLFMSVPVTVFSRGLIFAMIILVVLSAISCGVVTVAQTAAPGDTLYPVKQLVDTVEISMLGSKQPTISQKENQENIGNVLPTPSPDVLKDETEYPEDISQVEKEVTKTTKTTESQQDFKKLDKKENKVREQMPVGNTVKEEQKSEVKGVEAIKEIKETVKEIKEVKDTIDKNISLPAL